MAQAISLTVPASSMGKYPDPVFQLDLSRQSDSFNNTSRTTLRGATVCPDSLGNLKTVGAGVRRVY